MPSQHKTNPVTFRPPEDDRVWLYGHAEATGRRVGRFCSQALAEYRERVERGEESVARLDAGDWPGG